MSRKILFGCLMLGLATLNLGRSLGASVEFEFRTFTIDCDALGPAQSCDPVAHETLDGATVLDGFVTTDADIQYYTKLLLTPLADGRPDEFFSVAPPLGSSLEPPPQEYIDLFNALEFNSWFTTPGDTDLVTPPDADVGPWYLSARYEDDTDDGPQDKFHFMRLTFLPGSGGVFSGEVVVAGSGGPEPFGFSFTVPEPTGLLLMLIGGGLVAARRKRVYC